MELLVAFLVFSVRTVFLLVLKSPRRVMQYEIITDLPVVPDFLPKLDYMLASDFPQAIFSTKHLNLWPILQIFLLAF